MKSAPRTSHIRRQSASNSTFFRRRHLQLELLEGRLLLAADDIFDATPHRVGPLTADEFAQVLGQAHAGQLATEGKAAGPLFQKGPVANELTVLLAEYRQFKAETRTIGAEFAPSNPLVMLNENGMVDLHVSGNDVLTALPALESIGFDARFVLPEYQSLDGFLPIEAIENLEPAVAGLSVGLRPNWRPRTLSGSVENEADYIMGTRRVRELESAGFDGNGIRVGVLSDSFNRLSTANNDFLSGDLNQSLITIVDENTASTPANDEGRAMMQLIHDMAPAARLGFANGYESGEAGFANNINNLAVGFNADVIVDDVLHYTEPMFQDGIIAQRIANVVNNRDVAYFSAAGNFSDQAYFAEGPFETAQQTFGIRNFGGVTYTADKALDLDPGPGVDFRQTIRLTNGQEVIFALQWDDAFYDEAWNDLDFFLIDQQTNELVSYGFLSNVASDEPVEVVRFVHNGAPRNYEILIDNWLGPDPGFIKWVNYGDGRLGEIAPIEYATNSSTIVPHAGLPEAMAVGAVSYFAQQDPTSFTSVGPQEIFYTPNGTRMADSIVRDKPDFSGIDGSNNTFFGNDIDGDTSPNFFGTSAAAANVAAVAALARNAFPIESAQQIYDRLSNSARDLDAPGFDYLTGAGLVDAFAAIVGPTTTQSLDINDSFETGVETHWEINTYDNGRVQLGTALPADGAHLLQMDTHSNIASGLNEAILHFDASNVNGDVILKFQHKEYFDADNVMPATFIGSSNSDGVALSVDGNTWFRLTSFTGSNSIADFRSQVFNLSQIATALGLQLSADTQVKFQQFGRGRINSEGVAVDDVRVVVEGTPSHQWEPLGPFSALRGQTENITPHNNVTGAIHTVLAPANDADVLYVGAANGGIWKTTNATSLSPTWTPLTDDLPSLSIGAMTFDRSDATFETVYAGVGRYSSFGRIGNDRIGIVRSFDGGATWEVVDGGGVLRGKNISGIHVDGNVIVVSVNVADTFTYNNIGIFRSDDGGATFTQISNGGGSSTGLPGGASYDLVSDPNDPNVLYTSTVFSDGVGGQNGVFRSDDAGATWTRISSLQMEIMMTNDTSNVELAAGPQGSLFVAIINNGRLDGIFHSRNQLGFTRMDTPVTNENGSDVGLNPGGGKGPGPGSPPEEIAGGQGTIHFSIVADPVDPDVVYVGGDRQPLEFQFPTSIGARDFSGRLFRGDAGLSIGTQWVHLTHRNDLGAFGGGTLSNTAPHADSREMVFDANGNIIEVDDGGIYRRSLPRSNQGDWTSINGNLQVTEAHDVAWDAVSNTAFSGNQDTGTMYQPYDGAETWVSLSTADGGDVAIDDVSLASQGLSIRYSSFQNLGSFRRTIWDSVGNIVSTNFPALAVINGNPFVPSFVTKLGINSVDPSRILIQGGSSTYESLDQGETLSEVGVGVGSTSIDQNAVAYGGRKNGIDNVDVMWVGSGSDVFFRSVAGPLAPVASDPTNQSVLDLAVDPDDWATAYIIDTNQVFATNDEGNSWADVTGNLLAQASRIFSIAYIPGPVVDGLIVGTNAGVFVASTADLGTWVPLAAGIPNALTWDLEYDRADNMLVAGTLGRGVWGLDDASAVVASLFDFNAPRVQAIYASSSSWSAAMIDSVDGSGLGAGNGIGMELVGGDRPLPWNNVNQLIVRFSEPVRNFDEVTFELRDSTAPLPITVAYDPSGVMATITTSAPLQFSKLRVGISDLVTDLAGNRLDGDASGTEGGIYDFRFDVLPADANGDGRVNGADAAVYFASINTQAGQLAFNPYANWNGDNRINAADRVVYFANLNRRLSTLAEPGSPFSGSGMGPSKYRGGWSDGFFNQFGKGDDDDDDGFKLL